jgi:hypothetical protein
MASLRPLASPRLRTLSPFVLAIIAILLVAGCSASGGGDGPRLLSYQRQWPDGKIEQETIYTNGHIEMKHGDYLERISIGASDVSRLKDALAKPIPTGSPDDSPKRTLTLPDGTVIGAPRPDPGSVTELLERLLDTHTLG